MKILVHFTADKELGLDPTMIFGSFGLLQVITLFSSSVDPAPNLTVKLLNEISAKYSYPAGSMLSFIFNHEE